MDTIRYFILASAALLLNISVAFAGENPLSVAQRYPLSFNYDGKPFSTLNWTRETAVAPTEDITAGEGVSQTLSYLSPDGKLRLRVTVVGWNDAPVVELRQRRHQDGHRDGEPRSYKLMFYKKL